MLWCVKKKVGMFVKQPTNVMADSSKQGVGLPSKQKISPARETMDILMEMSKLLNTGLDGEMLMTCVRLCEGGVNPEALARVIKELRRESAAIKSSESGQSVS